MKVFLDKLMGWLVKASIVFLLLYAALLAFGPPQTPAPLYAVSDEQLTAYLPDIREIKPQQLPKVILDSQKPTLVMLYASWCSYCKVMVPHLLELQADGKLSGVALEFLSIDADKAALARYILSYGYDKKLTPYMVRDAASGDLMAVLQAKGSTHNGSIPFVLLFAPDGKLLAESMGLLNKRAILAFISDGMKASN
jgi:thiol-disulfide isomerase/thioredoxin